MWIVVSEFSVPRLTLNFVPNNIKENKGGLGVGEGEGELGRGEEKGERGRGGSEGIGRGREG